MAFPDEYPFRERFGFAHGLQRPYNCNVAVVGQSRHLGVKENLVNQKRVCNGWAFTAILAILSVTSPSAEASADGLYIAVPSPITSDAFTRIKNRIEGARANPESRPKTIVFDFNPEGKPANTENFGACVDMANYIANLRDTATVAYVHAETTGHTVFPVLACQQLILGPDGKLGQIVPRGGAKLEGYQKGSYKTILEQTHPQDVAIAQKMFDASVQLRKGKKNGADWYYDLKQRDDAEQTGVKIADTAPLPAAPDGSIGFFNAKQLRDLGMSQAIVDSREELLNRYGLPPSVVRATTIQAPVGYYYVVRGKITGGVKESIIRVANNVYQDGGNVLFLHLECSGGDFEAAQELAHALIDFQTRNEFNIIAYIPDQAPDTAAVLALGCSKIVMSQRQNSDSGEESTIGNFADMLENDENVNVQFWIDQLRSLAEQGYYPPVLVEGFLNRDLEIVRVHRKGNQNVRRLMSRAEFERTKEQDGDVEWVFDKQVKEKGTLLVLSASQAQEYRLADNVVPTSDPAAVYSLYGLEPSEVKEASTPWLDKFASFIKQPAVTVLLIVIGFTGLILELKVPGTAVPGIIAALCFILVFWAYTQFSGQVVMLAALIMLLGIILLLLEVFVLPGFGVAGISGILMILGSLALVTLDQTPDTWEGIYALAQKMAIYFFAMIGSVALAFTLARYLPNIPYANRMMLAPPSDYDDPSETNTHLPGAMEAASLLGAVGISVTVLRPAGTVRFGERFIDVVSEGGFVPNGARVQVVEVEGNRIVVKEV